MKKLIVLLVLASSSVFAQDAVTLKPANQAGLNVFSRLTMDDDSAAFLKGGEAVIGQSIVDTTANQLIVDYQNNELVSDEKYKDGLVRIKTVASAIKSDSSGRTVIVANGKNNSAVYLYANKKDDKMRHLKKGSEIDFICYGEGLESNRPVLGRCEFASEFVKKVVKKVINNISRASEDNYKPQSMTEMTILYTYKIYEHRLGPACLKSQHECRVAYGLAEDDKGKAQSDYSAKVMKIVADNKEQYQDLLLLPEIN
ncbi:OB-fold protein [Serratia sp. (in: enterobacteria)]|uniref:OB-fold protein n=1 Tax=Serratia sp. (in: enterobacteria) TaxID=616 RepID=UPI003988C4B4